MKPTTKQLIESFRYRREGYLPRSLKTDRAERAMELRLSRKGYGSEFVSTMERQSRDFRRELLSYRQLSSAPY